MSDDDFRGHLDLRRCTYATIPIIYASKETRQSLDCGTLLVTYFCLKVHLLYCSRTIATAMCSPHTISVNLPVYSIMICNTVFSTQYRRRRRSLNTCRSLLDIDLNTAFLTRVTTLAQLWEQVGDVVPWMPVEASAQSLLIEVMRNETDAAAEHEQAVEHTILQVLFGFFGAEGTAVAEEVHEADCDAAVDVEDQVVFLRGRHCFDGDCVVEEFGGWEVLQAELLDERDTEIWVVS